MKYLKTFEYININNQINWNQLLYNGTWTNKKINNDKYYLDFTKIKLAIENGANVDSCGTLEWATRNENFEIVKFCLEHNANVNYQDDSCKWTPLMSASNDGYVEIAKLLIDYDANPFIGNFQDYNTIDILYPNKLSSAVFSYENSSKEIQNNRDQIREYLEQNSIYMVSKKYNL